MGITSFYFWVFLIIVVALYYAFSANKSQWIILLISNMAFLLIVSGIKAFFVLSLGIIITWLGGMLIEKATSDKKKRVVLIVSIVALVCILARLKYVYLGQKIIGVLPIVGNTFSFSDGLSLLVPLGISYYTLSAIGYLISVYWGNYSYEKNILKIATFVSYFPQMTSGPITRYDEMGPQLFAIHSFAPNRIYYGIMRVVWGLFKKIVIADRAAIFVNAIYDDYGNYPGFWGVLAVLLFALQLYADFSGCMDIIYGASELMNIDLPENFNSPFMSETVSEFWDRWHITMGKWFRDFLLYPLLKSDFIQNLKKKLKKKFGKKKFKNLPTYLCMSVVWITIGIWHGGAFKYIFASGLLQGFYLIMGQMMRPLAERLVEILKINVTSYIWILFRRARTFFCLCTSWVFVRAASFSEGVRFVKNIFAKWNPSILFSEELFALGLTWRDFIILAIGIILMCFVSGKKEKGIDIRKEIMSRNIMLQWLIALTGLFVVIVFGLYGPGYDATDFIYKNF